MKKILIQIAFAVVFVIINALLLVGNVHKRSEIKRLAANQTALMADIQRYSTSDSLNACRVKRLTLTISELKESNLTLNRNLKDMQIKARDLQSAVLFNQLSNYQFTAQRTDTIIIRENRPPDTVYYYHYKDQWVNFEQIDGQVEIQTRDSLILLQHCRTRRFLWWTCRKYTGETTVKNYNPYSVITDVVSIDIEK